MYSSSISIWTAITGTYSIEEDPHLSSYMRLSLTGDNSHTTSRVLVKIEDRCTPIHILVDSMYEAPYFVTNDTQKM